MWKIILFIGLAGLGAGCSQVKPSPPIETSQGHINVESAPAGEIPELVSQVPILPEPEPPVELERYTVVVNEVPIKELLFALARDADINIDIDPSIEGVVTINAVEQTLPQILERVARQVDLRYQFEGSNLIIGPDEPYIQTYKVGYVNMSRDMDGSIAVSTQIKTAGTESGGAGGGAAAGGGGNNSATSVKSVSRHRFWESLAQNIHAILGQDFKADSAGTVDSTQSVIISPESGIVSVRATESQHREIQEFIDQVLTSVQRQILIEATIVEVTLSDQYQAGIDWESLRVAAAGGLSVAATLLGGPAGLAAVSPFTGTKSALTIGYDNPESAGRNISATIGLLREFGDTKILSSPQLMVLNNHTAILKVVENFVYFSVEQEVAPATVAGGAPAISTTTTAETVPVGLVMTVTPQVDDNDVVTLDVRPTVTSVVDTVNDPHPNLTIANAVPVIRVREMESILRISDRQIAVLGGLMQDTTLDNDRDTPILSDIPLGGEAFRARDRRRQKSELVIFLRPVVVKEASLNGDLQNYRQFLNNQMNIDSLKPKMKYREDSK